MKSNQLNSTQIKSNRIKFWFLRRGENRSTRRKTSRSRVENQQTQPTYDAESGNRTRATLVGGERSDTAPLAFETVLRFLETTNITYSKLRSQVLILHGQQVIRYFQHE